VNALIVRSALTVAAALGILFNPIVIAGGAQTVPTAQPWNQYRGNEGRTARIEWAGPQPGRSIPQSITSGAVVVWRTRIGTDAMLDASPVVGADGTIYLGATDRLGLSTDPQDETARLYAFSPGGKALWKSHLDGYIVRATPAVRRDGRLVVVGQKFSSDGALNERVFLVDQRNGARLGLSSARRALRTSPLLAAGSDEPLYLYDGKFIRWLDPFDRAGTDLGGMVFDLTSTSGVWDFLGDDCLPLNPLSWPCEFDSSSFMVPTEGGGALAPSPAYSAQCGSYAGAFLDRVILLRLGRKLPDGSLVWEKHGINAIQTPVLGKVGRIYLVTGELGSALEAYDQSGDRPWAADQNR
jgi:hypothetical protein